MVAIALYAIGWTLMLGSLCYLAYEAKQKYDERSELRVEVAELEERRDGLLRQMASPLFRAAQTHKRRTTLRAVPKDDN